MTADEAGTPATGIGEAEVSEPPPLDAQPRAPLIAEIEALLFISDKGLTVEQLATAAERPVVDVLGALSDLQSRYDAESSGLSLRQHASGWRLATAARCAGVLRRHVVDGQSGRLTAAALETLAVIAYQQPVSRGRIAGIRGVAVDGVVRTLVSRGLIEEVGVESTGATLYGTTVSFADKVGIESLTELPSLAPLLPDIETLSGDLSADDYAADAASGSTHQQSDNTHDHTADLMDHGRGAYEDAGASTDE